MALWSRLRQFLQKFIPPFSVFFYSIVLRTTRRSNQPQAGWNES